MRKNLLLVLLLAVQICFGQIISKDNTFASGGILATNTDITTQIVQGSNGEIYYTRNQSDAPASTNVLKTYVSKLTQNGILDATFGNSGTIEIPYNSYLNQIKKQDDGKLIVFGVTNSETVAISKILQNGQLDPTFGTAGTTIIPDLKSHYYNASCGIILQNEKILVHAISYGQNAQYPNQHVIIRLNTSGTIDTTFGNNGYLTTQGNIMNETFVRADNQNNIICFGNGGNISKFNSNGQPIVSFGNNGVVTLLDDNGYGFGIGVAFVDSSNKILLSSYNDDKLIRLNSDGTLDNNFNYNTNTNSGLNGGAWIQSITEKNGSYYIGGSGIYPENLISKLTQNGSVDLAFNTYLQTDTEVDEIIVNDNNIIVEGRGIIVKYLLNNTTLSTTESTKTNNISFENPVKQNLVFSTKEKVSKIEICSLDGKTVKTIKENNTNVSELVKGIYFVKTTFENGKTVVKKLIKD